MIRQTSIEAYNHIKANGLLSHRRWQVYDYIYKFGPCTSFTAWRNINPNIANGGITTRFSELEQMGVIQIVGETIQPETGMSAVLWDVTDRLPMKLQKKENKFSILVCKEHLKIIREDKKHCLDGAASLFPCKVVRMVEK